MFSFSSVLCFNDFFMVLDRLSGDGDDLISTWDEVNESFDSMNLHENLLRGIYAYGMFQYLSFSIICVEFMIFLYGLFTYVFGLT